MSNSSSKHYDNLNKISNTDNNIESRPLIFKSLANVGVVKDASLIYSPSSSSFQNPSSFLQAESKLALNNQPSSSCDSSNFNFQIESSYSSPVFLNNFRLDSLSSTTTTSEIDKSDENLFVIAPNNKEDISISENSNNNLINRIFYLKTDSIQNEEDLFVENSTNKLDNLLESIHSTEITPLLPNMISCQTSETNQINSSTLPFKLTEENSLKRYGIRRHYSAPQPDAKWLQVYLILYSS
jgi:hypothetical protein